MCTSSISVGPKRYRGIVSLWWDEAGQLRRQRPSRLEGELLQLAASTLLGSEENRTRSSERPVRSWADTRPVRALQCPSSGWRVLSEGGHRVPLSSACALLLGGSRLAGDFQMCCGFIPALRFQNSPALLYYSSCECHDLKYLNMKAASSPDVLYLPLWRLVEKEWFFQSSRGNLLLLSVVSNQSLNVLFLCQVSHTGPSIY